MSRTALRLFTLGALFLLLQGCLLTKDERQNRRANRKLDRLTEKYPQLLEKDTLRDTILIPEIKLDTFVQVNDDVSGVDSILLKFNERLDSVTSLQLGDEIKYYITNRQVIEDTLTHVEDGVTVKVWQDGDVIQISVHKPAEEEVIEIPYEKVVRAPALPWYKQVAVYLQKWGITFLILGLIVWLVLKGLRVIKKLYTGGR